MPSRSAALPCLLSALACAPGAAFAQSAAPNAPAASQSAGDAQAPHTVKPVTVTGHKDELRTSPDKRSYDITGDLHAATGSIADVLRNVPSVDVSPEGQVSLRGDSNVVIYVDGKPSTIFKGAQAGQALQSLPADQYERVEVMTNPSAAFAPDGSAGIINLITKKTHKPGGSGTVRLADGTNGQWNGGVTANRRADKLTLSFNAGLRHDRGLFTSASQRETFDAAGRPVSTFHNAMRGQHASDSGDAHGSAEWRPDARTQVTAELSAMGFRNRWGQAAYDVEGGASGAPTQVLDQGGASRYAVANVSGGLTLQRNFDGEGHTLVLSLTRDRSTSENRQANSLASTTPPAAPTYQNQRADGVDASTVLKGDYTRPMPAKATLKAGFEIRSEANAVDTAGFLAAASPTAPDDPDHTDSFRFERRISAVYSTYDRPVGRFDVLAGLRLEATEIHLNNVTTSFLSHSDDARLYPTLHLRYKLTERQSLTASWSERVQRPWSSQYDPFRFVGPFYVRQGNPGLKPEETQQVELAYEYRRGDTDFLVTAYDKDKRRGFEDVSTPLPGNVVLSMPENLVRSRNTGFELAASGRLWKKLKYNLSGDVFRNQFDAAGLGIGAPQAGWTAFGRASLDWEIDSKDLLQLQGYASGKRLTATSYFEPAPRMDLGFRHKFSDRLALTLTANDVLNISGFRSATDTPTLRETGWSKPHWRAAVLSLTWSFGAGPKRDPGFEYGPQN